MKEKFDVIDVSVFPYFSCFTAKAVTLAKRTPLVLTWHEVWDDYWYSYLGRPGFFGKLVERIVSKLTRNNVAVSRWTKRKMEAIGINSNHIHVILNGVDLEQINSIKPSDKRSDIIFAGRLIREKNMDLLLKAIALVKSSNPSVYCIIMGDGPEKENLLKLTEELGLTDNVLFTGFVEYEELIANIKASKVLALPSKREGFGMVVIEGFACGKPVITVNSRDNAAQEIVKDSVNGFVVDAEEEELASSIQTLLVDENLYCELAKNAIIEAQKYDWGTMCSSSVSIYAQSGPVEILD
jgi:glycosyltransferase involved in cell wall biosynthesis